MVRIGTRLKMLTPSYIPIDALEQPDLYKATKAFILAFGFPILEPDNVFQGWGNNMSLPANTNEYAVMTVLNTNRRGTTVENIVKSENSDETPERYELRTYFETLMQIDMCSDSDLARQRAYNLESTLRSSVGVNFYKQYGITAQYAENIFEAAFTNGSNQFVRRYILTFHLAYWAGVNVGSAWFNDYDLKRVEDVEVHHPRIGAK